MPLNVFSYCAWFSPSDFGGVTWADVKAQNCQGIYNATKFVKAIKGEPIHGYADIVVPGVGTVRLDESSRGFVFDWFAAMVRDTYQNGAPGPRVHLVPAPGSSATSRTGVMAGAAANVCNAIATSFGAGWDVQPVLWWQQPIPSARKQGGSRDAAFKCTMLVAPMLPRGTVGTGHHWILVDDNISSGGTLRAMAKRLGEANAAPSYALCVSHTVDTIEPGFQFLNRELPDL